MATVLILKAYIGVLLAKFEGGAYNGNKIYVLSVLFAGYLLPEKIFDRHFTALGR